MPSFSSRFDGTTALLTTELHGRCDADDVRAWHDGLHEALAGVPDGSDFRALVDLTGYAWASLDAHKAMRVVAPAMLLDHGFRTGLLDLVPVAPVTLRAERGIRCLAVAHVHHEVEKMALFDARLGRPEERFFSDRAAAERWLATLPRPVSTRDGL